MLENGKGIKSWQKTMAKEALATGKQYVSQKKGKLMPPKVPKVSKYYGIL